MRSSRGRLQAVCWPVEVQFVAVEVMLARVAELLRPRSRLLANVLPALLQAARDAADDVRGAAHLDGAALVAQVLGDVSLDGIPDADTSVQILTAAGLLGGEGLGPMAPVMALVETLPDVVVERLLVELLAAGIEQ